MCAELNRNTDEGIMTLPVCGNKDGMLPGCAPLANPYVPYQQEGFDHYKAGCALIRGTIFPGLDLPYGGQENRQEKSGTALHDLQALHFVITELGLYLDTHSSDTEAAELFGDYVELYQQAVQQFEQNGGILTQMDALRSGSYDWLNDPWPWDIETEG